ncbi:hypothetical protein GGD83_003126 [Rhodoblastus sphagnicola]|nr:hypothetical protein [Rhodoblastus sphagnicola]MBB4199312.1 hypothetical protein [Rhodoblastus sphagnicola]
MPKSSQALAATAIHRKGLHMLTTSRLELLSIFAAFAFMVGVLIAVW